MAPQNYKKLGKLPKATIDFFLEEIMKLKDLKKPKHQWIWLTYKLNYEFLKIFENNNLYLKLIKNGVGEIRYKKNYYNQKAFYTPAGCGFLIHKDGINDKAALNIALQCNDDDWVRWYRDEDVYKFGDVPAKVELNYSRNAHAIKDFRNFPYEEELRTEVGDVYVVNTDVFHSYVCSGPKDRIILQTKFEENPSFQELCDLLSEKSFKNIKDGTKKL